MNVSVCLGIDTMKAVVPTSWAEYEQLEIVNNQVFWPQSRGLHHLMMIYCQGKHFYMCYNAEMTGVEIKNSEGGKIITF